MRLIGLLVFEEYFRHRLFFPKILIGRLVSLSHTGESFLDRHEHLLRIDIPCDTHDDILRDISAGEVLDKILSFESPDIILRSENAPTEWRIAIQMLFP